MSDRAPVLSLEPARYRRFWLKILAALVLILTGSALWLWLSGWGGTWHHLNNMRSTEAQWRGTGMWLPDYQVVIEALPVEGIIDNLSGLTYNAETDTLFAVINRPPSLAEISTEGKLLRLVTLEGALDPEGITHLGGTRFVVAEEGGNRLSLIEVGPGDDPISFANTPHLTLDQGSFHNLGLEGVTWDAKASRLLVAFEMLPMRVISIEGMGALGLGLAAPSALVEWQIEALSRQFAPDLSSLEMDPVSGNLLLLSDLGAAVAEYTPQGQPVSVLPLWAGWHGLQATVGQAEGLALSPKGALYLVSEPNLFYSFRRESRLATLEAEGK